MKKRINLILVFCLVLLISLLFVACNKDKKDSEPTPAPTPAHTHTWASEWSKNDTKHWHACSGCTEKNDEANHIYDDDHDNICDECGYEREVAADHIASLDWSSNATQHWHACAHDGCTIVFDLNNHMIQNVLSYDETGHWYECSVCEYHKDFEAHVYDDNHDTTCNTCGYVRSIGDHAAATAWTKDATKHWHVCEHDGCELKYNEGEHSIQSGWTTDENGHWHACDVCDLKDSYADHIYDNDHDTTCNICGYVREIAADHTAATAWQTNETIHWHACNHAGCTIIFNEGEHVYDDDHDTTCNTCSYVREIAADHTAATAWQTNETSHWHDCNHAGCTIKYSEGEHVYDDDHDTTCNTCEYVRSIGDHAAASTWTSDVTHHWKACNHSGCTIKYNYAAHTFSAGVCTVCGEKEHTPGLEFTLKNDTYEVSGYTGSSPNVTIASTYKGKFVTSIGLRAFQNAIILTLTMPDTVTNIGMEAFKGCKSMTSISLSNNLQSIGVRAFHECWALGSITIPNSVTSIEQDAFYDCSALTTVVIGNGVSTLSLRMFYSCDKLANVTFSNSVHTIETDAFTYCTKLNSITFNGTIANWNAITKDTGWKPSSLTTIHCTDGDVAP